MKIRPRRLFNLGQRCKPTNKSTLIIGLPPLIIGLLLANAVDRPIGLICKVHFSNMDIYLMFMFQPIVLHGSMIGSWHHIVVCLSVRL